MLEEMIKNGQLLDANGVKIESLEDSGISFAMTMTEGFKSLIAEVQKLTDLIAKSLNVAIQNIPDASFEIRGEYVPPDDLPDGYDHPRVHEMAAGGSGRVTKPTLFLAGEAGPEDVAFSGANKSFGSGDEGGASLDSLESMLGRYLRAQPQMMATAMRDALIQAGV
jgi:hypothetical protein